MSRVTAGGSVALVVVLGLVAAACAGGGDDGTLPAGGGGHDASVHAGHDGAGPSPDAIVLGRDAKGDEPDDDAEADGGGGKSCATLPDGTPCGPAPDACHDVATCRAGACGAAAAKADGTVCAPAPDACHTDGTCSAGACGGVGTKPDGTGWSTGDATAICCGGHEVHANTASDCGACGIACNASNGESCQALGGHWFCRGCMASADCWSRCCSQSFTPYTCAASDCNGNCSSQYCPTGTHCVAGNGASSDYCAY